MIPKIIHQLWIGPHPCPVEIMHTWKNKHPDYEYILWDERLIFEEFHLNLLEDNLNNTNLKSIEAFITMKELVGKTGAALLILWALGMITIVVLGAGSDGPIDGPELINAWTFYGFVLGLPTVAIAMMRWGGQK
jgi:hypothetical protein